MCAAKNKHWICDCLSSAHTEIDMLPLHSIWRILRAKAWPEIMYIDTWIIFLHLPQSCTWWNNKSLIRWTLPHRHVSGKRPSCVLQRSALVWTSSSLPGSSFPSQPDLDAMKRPKLTRSMLQLQLTSYGGLSAIHPQRPKGSLCCETCLFHSRWHIRILMAFNGLATIRTKDSGSQKVATNACQRMLSSAAFTT